MAAVFLFQVLVREIAILDCKSSINPSRQIHGTKLSGCERSTVNIEFIILTVKILSK